MSVFEKYTVMNRNIGKTLVAFLLALALYFFLDFFVLAIRHDEAAFSIKAAVFALGSASLVILYRITRNDKLLQ